jgi:transcriptional regulator with XRE-family HTH domain
MSSDAALDIKRLTIEAPSIIIKEIRKGGKYMSLGSYLREVREERQLSLRDVERLAKENKLGAELSSGYLSVLEQDKVKEPSPRILFALAKIYEKDYLYFMKQAGYMPDARASSQSSKVAFRGAAQLNQEQRERIQRFIDFELSDSQRRKRKRKE